MGLYVDVVAIGPFAAGLRDCLDHPPERYATTRAGATVMTTLFGVIEGTGGGHLIAAALGVADVWDFNQHELAPARIDDAAMRAACARLANGDAYLRDLARLRRLAAAGFRFYLRPNG